MYVWNLWIEFFEPKFNFKNIMKNIFVFNIFILI